MNFDLEKLLPHKKPMILIDDIIDYSLEENRIESIVKIQENSMFFDKSINGISSCVGIEYMAQTIGCFAFLKAKLEKPKIGFLLGTRYYDNKIDKFNLNETYSIKATQNFSGDGIVSFECLIYNQQQEEVVQAALNVFQIQDEKDILKIN